MNRITSIADTNRDISKSTTTVSTEELILDRLDKHLDHYYEIKNPNIIQIDDHFIMFASIGNSITHKWIIGRFEAKSPNGPWYELEPVEFINLDSPQLCSPIVTVIKSNGQNIWHMYLQTDEYENGNKIVEAYSTDGNIFVRSPQSIKINQDFSSMTSEELISLQPNPTNQPEWEMAGAKIIQLTDDLSIILGVCQVPLPDTNIGKRQRIYMASSKSLQGPFTCMVTPFEPISLYGKRGENSCPDPFIVGDTLWIVYQERYGTDDPWYLRIGSFNITQLINQFQPPLSMRN